jgi:hypothetical protein
VSEPKPESESAEHPFDVFFHEGGYQPGEEPQAFADWLAGKTRKRQVGISSEGAVEGHPPPEPSA